MGSFTALIAPFSSKGPSLTASLATDPLAVLLPRIANGDRAALQELYLATSAKLFAVVLRILSNRDESEDVLQDVYITIWRRADRFEAGRASVMAWLATIARNRADRKSVV